MTFKKQPAPKKSAIGIVEPATFNLNPQPRKIVSHKLTNNNRKPVTAIFDIGKTNKKFILFDENYSIVYKRQIFIEETKDDDGFPCEDLSRVVEWMRSEFELAGKQREFFINSLNFSTYGASLVHLDQEGKPLTPLYNYLKPYPDEFLQEFYEKYGGREEFSFKTASPPMGMLNSGLQLYRLKKAKPEIFRKIRCSLHFPQYLHYQFTGKTVSEKTSIGCHTAMWDFKKDGYHRWIHEEQILHLLPEIHPVSSVSDVNDKGKRLKVGPGIHDSSAALAPYLLTSTEPFILLSTGTWSIAMNPFTTEPLTVEELEKDCLLYMNIYGKPVKASRLFLGSEYSHQKKKLEQYFGTEGGGTDIEPDPGLLQKLANGNHPEHKLKLEKAHTSGPYPQKAAGNWELSTFGSFKEAYHQLMLDLVSIQVDSLNLVRGSEKMNQIIVTGGFGNNDFFAGILAAFLPGKKVYTAVTSHASALGAALIIAEGNRKDRDRVKQLIGLRLHKPIANVDIAGYSWASQDANHSTGV